MNDSPAHHAIDAIWRIEFPRLIARLARMFGDVGLAEDFAHDALAAALEQWPANGVPDNAGAWLMAAGNRRAIDHLRRDRMLERKHAEWQGEMNAQEAMAPDLDSALDNEIGDDMLRLVFTACHPVLSVEARVALTLRRVGGLTTEEIGRGFLTTVPLRNYHLLPSVRGASSFVPAAASERSIVGGALNTIERQQVEADKRCRTSS